MGIPFLQDLLLFGNGAPTTRRARKPALYFRLDGPPYLYVNTDGGTTWKVLLSQANYGAPAFTLGTTNAAGSTDTLVQSDAQLALFDVTAPVTQAIGDSAATGSAGKAARRDHQHGMPAFGAPSTQAMGDSASNGVATTVPRSDHKHGMPSFAAPSPTFSTTNSAGTAATALRSDAQFATFDATTPANVASAAATGSAGTMARRDHVHTIASSTVTPAMHTSVPMARAMHSANQAIATGTVTVLAFDSETFDTDTIHDTVTNNSRLTAKTAGRYRITASAEFAANATGVRSLLLRTNGTTTTIGAVRVPNAGAADVTIVECTTTWTFSVNDYVEVFAYQTSGGNLNVNASGSYSPVFQMEWIGP